MVICRVTFVGVLALAVSFVGQAEADEPATRSWRVAGYLPDYRAPQFQAAQARGLTDLILFSAQPTATGELDRSQWPKERIERIRAQVAGQPIRLMLSVGGWERSQHFAAAAASPASRQRFALAAARLCQEEKLAGLDLDWEHPRNAVEQENYGLLLAELKLALEPRQVTLSVTVAAWQKLPRSAFEAVDWVQIMAYDQAGRHATVAGAERDVKTLLDAGAPASKLILGVPFYGRHVTERNRTLTYGEIVRKYSPAAGTDEVDGYYFNSPETLRQKVAFARRAGLGGLMIWEVGQDATGQQALLPVLAADAASKTP